jgi:homogentisate 1,2-dioxygenase
MEGVPRWERGVVSRQAHVALPDGTVEEEHGRSGFFGPASHLYRLHPPTDWVSVEGPAAHRAYSTERVGSPDDRWPTPLLVNAEVTIGVWHVTSTADELLRDADGDLLAFVHTGRGVLATEYGPLRYRPGDHLVIPRGTTFRFEPAEPTHLLTVEAHGSAYRLPDRGMLGRHALFDPGVLEVPEPDPVAGLDGHIDVVVRRGGQDTVVTYPFHPFDVIGWKGDVAPVRLNVDDIRPVSSARYHLPPSAHTTWVADGFVVCTFAPRPLEDDPEAIRLPFFHRNVDYDEVLFYHRGTFLSRAGLAAGELTWHPAGLHHGPQPEARRRDAEAAAAQAPGERRVTEEVAIMVDTRRPLAPAAAAPSAEIDGYVASWHPDR